jgi:hypothetical protein
VIQTFVKPQSKKLPRQRERAIQAASSFHADGQIKFLPALVLVT